jgi:hypothetical protein
MRQSERSASLRRREGSLKATACFCAAFVLVGMVIAGHGNGDPALVARDAGHAFRTHGAPDAQVRNCRELGTAALDAVRGKPAGVYRCEVYLELTTGWSERCLTDSSGEVAFISCEGVSKL